MFLTLAEQQCSKMQVLLCVPKGFHGVDRHTEYQEDRAEKSFKGGLQLLQESGKYMN